LQPTSEPGKYYDSYGSNIGIFDIKTNKLTNQTETNLYIKDYSRMWIDESNDMVYIAINGDLVELPLKIA
jgi:hypothetical protein